jgi:hypothetical protein
MSEDIKDNVVLFPVSVKAGKEEEVREIRERINPALLAEIKIAATAYLLDNTVESFTESQYKVVEHLIMLGVTIGMQYSIDKIEGVYDDE